MAGNRMLWRERSSLRIRARRRDQGRIMTALEQVDEGQAGLPNSGDADSHFWFVRGRSGDAAPSPADRPEHG